MILLIFLIIYGPLFEARLSGTLALISSRLSVPNVTEQANITQRLTYRRNALTLWRTSPWLGMGAGSSSLASLSISSSEGIANPGPVHSVPLLLLVDLGPMGLAAWGMLILAVLKLGWQSRHGLSEKPMQAAWTVASVVLLLMGCFDHHFLTYQQGRVALWLTLGAWAAEVK
jgi:O-antigen ligase